MGLAEREVKVNYTDDGGDGRDKAAKKTKTLSSPRGDAKPFEGNSVAELEKYLEENLKPRRSIPEEEAAWVKSSILRKLR